LLNLIPCSYNVEISDMLRARRDSSRRCWRALSCRSRRCPRQRTKWQAEQRLVTIVGGRCSSPALNNTTTRRPARTSDTTRKPSGRLTALTPTVTPQRGGTRPARPPSSIARRSLQAAGPAIRRSALRITFADPPGIVFRDSGAPKEAELDRPRP